METQRPKSKRQQKNDESKQCKSQRLASPVKSVDPTKITDVNDDCLVNFFEHLDPQNLLNVAMANANLRPAAAEVYKRRFDKKLVRIERCETRPNTRAAARNDCMNKSFALEFDTESDTITIRGLKTCLMYLRCFGPYITDLLIDYGKSKSMSKHYEHVHQYINDYCAGSLISFAFYYMQKDAIIEQFQKGFANVKKVRIFDNCLILQSPSFVKWFPELRDLKLNDLRAYRFIEKPFQHLEHLYIGVSYAHHSGFLRETIATNLLNGIHQLKILQIESEHVIPLTSIDIWLDVIKEQSSITEFYVEDNGPMNTAEVSRLIEENSTLIGLILPNYRLTIDDAIVLVRQLNSLMKFMFQMLDSEYSQLVSQLDDKWEAKKNYTYDVQYTEVLLKRKM